MQIVKRARLRAFWEKHNQAEDALELWFSMVKKADWAGPQDVKRMFGATVDFLSDNRVVFDIAGNKYRLVVRIAYQFKAVQIKFVGTHKEYDKINAETVQ